jgi:hypothetical protein
MKIKTHDLSSVVVSPVMVGGLAIPLVASAQDAPLWYIASPKVYKLLAVNDQFRVILQTKKPGERDAWHSHSTLAGYRLSDCTHEPIVPTPNI